MTRYPALILVVLILPAFCAAAAEMDVRGYGAAGDGVALDTPAIQRAINACAAESGGRVIFPADRYLTGSLRLASLPDRCLGDYHAECAHSYFTMIATAQLFSAVRISVAPLSPFIRAAATQAMVAAPASSPHKFSRRSGSNGRVQAAQSPPV